MYKSRRLKKLWGNKPVSLPPQENHDTALAEEFSSPSLTDPNYSNGTVDDDEGQPLSTSRTSFTSQQSNLISNVTDSTGPSIALNDSSTKPSNFDLITNPSLGAVIPQTHIRTDMSDSLGGSERHINTPGHVRFSEDVADRNVKLGQTSAFPDPSTTDLVERFSEEVADRNIDQSNAVHPKNAPKIAGEASRTGSVSPYAMVELHDRKFSTPKSDILSDDVYRRIGRKPTGYVDLEDFDEMDTKAARRKSLVIAGRRLVDEVESDGPGLKDSNFTDSMGSTRRSQLTGDRLRGKDQSRAATSDSKTESHNGNMRVPPVLQEGHTETPASQDCGMSDYVSNRAEQRDTTRPRPTSSYSELENAAVESVNPQSPTDRTSNRTATSEDSEPSINGGPRALLPYAEHEDTHSSENSINSKSGTGVYRASGVDAAESLEWSGESIDGSSRASSRHAEKTTSEPSVSESDRSLEVSSQARQLTSPRTPPKDTNALTDNYVIKDPESPIDLSSVVELSNSLDTKIDINYAPAVTRETVLPTTHHIREERITREYHNHDVYHRILPIHEVEILPPRHFRHSPDGKLVEVLESTIPDGRKAFYPLSPASTQKMPARIEISPPTSGWRRPFTARFWKGTDGDAKEEVGEDGVLRTERTWVHPPTLEEGGKLTGQTEPFYLDKPSDKVADLGGLVETSDRMPGGWDGTDELPDRASPAANRFSIPRKPVRSE
jgi:hypothetical protein